MRNLPRIDLRRWAARCFVLDDGRLLLADKRTAITDAQLQTAITTTQLLLGLIWKGK